MATFADDFAFGIASERTNHKILETIFKTPFVRRGGMYTFDFDNTDTDLSKTIYAELKTRRIPHNKFKTALIGSNKVKYAEQSPNKEYWFIYNYQDGIFGVKYDKEKFDTYDCDEFQRGERPDCNDKPQLCYFIPYTDLTRF
jgi:hypothetical protein